MAKRNIKKTKTTVRERLLLVAIEIVAVQGLSAVTAKSVTARLKVTPPVFYRHFPSRDDLIFEIFERACSFAVEILFSTGQKTISIASIDIELVIRSLFVALKQDKFLTYAVINILSDPLNESLKEKFEASRRYAVVNAMLAQLKSEITGTTNMDPADVSRGRFQVEFILGGLYRCLSKLSTLDTRRTEKKSQELEQDLLAVWMSHLQVALKAQKQGAASIK